MKKYLVWFCKTDQVSAPNINKKRQWYTDTTNQWHSFRILSLLPKTTQNSLILFRKNRFVIFSSHSEILMKHCHPTDRSILKFQYSETPLATAILIPDMTNSLKIPPDTVHLWSLNEYFFQECIFCWSKYLKFLNRWC